MFLFGLDLLTYYPRNKDLAGHMLRSVQFNCFLLTGNAAVTSQVVLSEKQLSVYHTTTCCTPFFYVERTYSSNHIASSEMARAVIDSIAAS